MQELGVEVQKETETKAYELLASLSRRGTPQKHKGTCQKVAWTGLRRNAVAPQTWKPHVKKCVLPVHWRSSASGER